MQGDVVEDPRHGDSPDELPEAELVRRAAADPAAFDVLYRRYLPAVYRYCLARTGSVPDAEDAASATFLATLRALGRYREQGRFQAWLFTIARREVAAHWRRRRETAREMRDLEAHVDGPGRDERMAIEAALASLTTDRRDAIALRFYGGLSVAEIAQAMDKGESAVKMLLHRGLKQLAGKLAEEGDA
jgi:RNA polymerase sigma-70 factor (ECF subfamily)